MFEELKQIVTEQMEPFNTEGKAEKRCGKLIIKVAEANPQATEVILQDITKNKLNLVACTEFIRKKAMETAKKNKLKECEYDDEDYISYICEFYGIEDGISEPLQDIKIPVHAPKVFNLEDFM